MRGAFIVFCNSRDWETRSCWGGSRSCWPKRNDCWGKKDDDCRCRKDRDDCRWWKDDDDCHCRKDRDDCRCKREKFPCWDKDFCECMMWAFKKCHKKSHKDMDDRGFDEDRGEDLED